MTASSGSAPAAEGFGSFVVGVTVRRRPGPGGWAPRRCMCDLELLAVAAAFASGPDEVCTYLGWHLHICTMMYEIRGAVVLLYNLAFRSMNYLKGSGFFRGYSKKTDLKIDSERKYCTYMGSHLQICTLLYKSEGATVILYNQTRMIIKGPALVIRSGAFVYNLNPPDGGFSNVFVLRSLSVFNSPVAKLVENFDQ